jgi:hypothetical protein
MKRLRIWFGNWLIRHGHAHWAILYVLTTASVPERRWNGPKS